MKRGRRKALQPTLSWIEESRKAFESSVSDAPKLITESFPEWCKTLNIRTPEGLKPFKLFDWQRRAAEVIAGPNSVNGRQIVVLSSRQTGKTSLFLALAGYLSLANAQFSGVIVHKNKEDSGFLARRLKQFLYKNKFNPDNLGLVGFPTSGSHLHFRSANPIRGQEGAEGVGRGLPSTSIAIFEEAAILHNLAQCMGVIGPSLTWGSAPKATVLISTAGSKHDNYFYDRLCLSAGGAEKLEEILSGIRAGTAEPFQILNLEGEGPIGIISSWRCIPQFAAEGEAFLERTQRELSLSDSQMDSEYRLMFSSSDASALFDFNLVMAAQSEQPLYKPSPDSVLYMGVDPAAAGKDYAVGILIEVTRDDEEREIYTVCQMYRKRTGVSEVHLAAVSGLIGDYQPIVTTIESNSIGQLWHENLSGMGHSSAIEKFNTSQASKEVLVARLQIALERGVLRIPKGSVIISELLAFRRDDAGKLGGGGSAHDDTVVALALALYSSGFNR